jgi:hypothetical protein
MAKKLGIAKTVLYRDLYRCFFNYGSKVPHLIWKQLLILD